MIPDWRGGFLLSWDVVGGLAAPDALALAWLAGRSELLAGRSAVLALPQLANNGFPLKNERGSDGRGCPSLPSLYL